MGLKDKIVQKANEKYAKQFEDSDYKLKQFIKHGEMVVMYVEMGTDWEEAIKHSLIGLPEQYWHEYLDYINKLITN